MPVLLGELGCWCHRWGPQVTYIKSRQLEAPPSQPAYHRPLPEGAGPPRASGADPEPPPPRPSSEHLLQSAVTRCRAGLWG